MNHLNAEKYEKTEIYNERYNYNLSLSLRKILAINM